VSEEPRGAPADLLDRLLEVGGPPVRQLDPVSRQGDLYVLQEVGEEPAIFLGLMNEPEKVSGHGSSSD
jgi:hypothetical protein